MLRSIYMSKALYTGMRTALPASLSSRNRTQFLLAAPSSVQSLEVDVDCFSDRRVVATRSNASFEHLRSIEFTHPYPVGTSDFMVILHANLVGSVLDISFARLKRGTIPSTVEPD